MAFDILIIFIFLIVGLGFVLVSLSFGALVRPRRILKPERLGIYECGEKPLTGSWYNFNPRFYLLALVFLIFDVEVVVTFPVIVVLRSFAEKGWGLIAFVEILLFVIILVTGLAFLWRRGDLEWIKTIERPEEEGTR